MQVRRASGSPQGILNMAVSLIDNSMRSMPIYTQLSESVIKGSSSDPTDKKLDKENDNDDDVNAKIQLWRSRSEKSDLNFDDFYPPKAESICNGGSIVNGSICNGSIVNDSELCSDVGPSASIVAAAIAKGLYPPPTPAEVEERGSSILEDLTVEEATAKGYKSKAGELPTVAAAAADRSSGKLDSLRQHSRRHSDAGLFSCFAYGFEFTIVCGTKNSRDKNSSSSEKPMIKRSPSHQNLSI
ncbi:hypothetical protein Vadar_032657 [Vaccinium darrowii]|uniref:Uncharacterized protein n=1 Tax=Vaccinium darrowii TaxID=229202 RepID=A0ACB7Z7Z3_9ERIC|nr:hypothetical protein Vadar_032657 [Vaccinium darrowii]